MGQVKSKLSRRARDTQQILPIVPNDVRFRVLIIGRANAGKTSILQRVCDTTDSPEIYRLGPEGERAQVRSHSQLRLRFDDFIIWSGSTRRITRGWKRLFLLVTADHEDSPCSVACIMSRTKSSLRIMGDMFSTTPVDSRQVVKKSWRRSKSLSVVSRGRGGCRIDCTQYGLFLWAPTVANSQSCFSGTAFRWTIIGQH